MSPLLSGAFAKLRRARKQIDDLDSAVRKVIDGDSYAVVVEPYRYETIRGHYTRSAIRELGLTVDHLWGGVTTQDGGADFTARVVERFRIRLRITKSVPVDDWSVIVGEIVHDLRSALDHLVWALAVKHQATKGISPPTGRIPRKGDWGHLGFPVVLDAGSRDQHWKSQIGSKLKLVDPTIRKDFRPLQPFHRHRKHPDRHALAILDELWTGDKHHTINLVVSLARLKGIGPGGPIFRTPSAPKVRTGLMYRRRLGPVEDGTVLARVRLDPTSLLNEAALDEYVKDNLDIAFHVAFEKGPLPHNGQRVIETLERLFDTVSAVLIKFQQTEFS